MFCFDRAAVRVLSHHSFLGSYQFVEFARQKSLKLFLENVSVISDRRKRCPDRTLTVRL